MTDQNTTQPGTRISASLWNEFREDIKERRGGTRGHMRTELENAIRSYIQASKGGDLEDRIRRIENKLESVDEGVGDLLDDERRKKNKDSSVSDTVKERVEKIGERLEREADGAHKVHESLVNNAIEDIAGSSRPTLNRYKEMLEQRHIAHEWPKEGVDHWWVDAERFVEVVSTNFPDKAYEYEQKYGKWWQEQLDKSDLETERGIQ